MTKPAKPPSDRTIKSFFDSLDDDVDAARKLLDKDPSLLTLRDSRGQSPLHVAASNSKAEIVELLLARGAAIDAKDEDGKTAYAVADGVAVRKVLRANGDPGFGPRGGKQLSPKVRPNAKAKTMEIERGALGTDRNGNVWFGGYSGLFCYDGKAMTRYVFEETFAVSAVGAGRGNDVYFATNWGLLEFRGGVFTLFSSEDSELFDSHVTDMWCAPDGTAYMVSYEHEAEYKHISVFDGHKFKVLAPGVDFPEELQITCLSFDADGNLAIGAEDAFATQRDGAWHVEREFDDVISCAAVYDAIVERDATWLATSDGLVVQRGKKFVMQDLPETPKTLCKDGDALWIGYYGGVCKLVDGKLTQVDAELPDEDVARIVRSSNGRVWIHAGDGAAYVDGSAIRRFA